jgi:hypothetical protein
MNSPSAGATNIISHLSPNYSPSKSPGKGGMLGKVRGKKPDYQNSYSISQYSKVLLILESENQNASFPC